MFLKYLNTLLIAPKWISLELEANLANFITIKQISTFIIKTKNKKKPINY
jgi:hypothetical protein